MRWDILALALMIGVLIFTNTWAPYHLDSAGYVMRAVDFWNGNLDPSWRVGFALILAPFIPLYLLIGNYNILHTIFVLLSFAGIFVIYQYLRRSSDLGAVLALILFLSAPAVMFTLNVGKGDVILVALTFLSFLFYGNLPILSGVSASLAFTAKEPSVFLLALLSPHIIRDLFSKERNHKRVLFFFLGVLLLSPYVIHQLLWIFSPHSSTIGRIDPVYAPYVFPHLLDGFGLTGTVLLLLSLISLRFKESRREVLPFIFLFFISLAILGSNSTTNYRTAVIPLSLLLFPAVITLRSLQRFSLPLIISVVILAFLSFSDAFPTIYFRGATNLPAHFSSAVSEFNANYILTMDFCGLYRYYADLNCITHPVYPKPTDYNAIISEIAQHIPDGILLSPDFFAYADDNFAKWFLSTVKLEPLGSEWFEDYHAVRSYPLLEDSGCVFRQTGTQQILSVTADVGDLLCHGNGYHVVKDVYAFQGHLLYGVRRAPIYQVVGIVKEV